MTIAVARDNVDNIVAIDGIIIRDNAVRTTLEGYDDFGDNLPTTPTVLLGVPPSPSERYTANNMALEDVTQLRFNVDGGPSWARDSLSQPSVSMAAYSEYCATSADGDDAPLYIFDQKLPPSLTASYTIPQCFAHDAMSGIASLRPLPPLWLLVAAKRSGTPIHDHPHTVAWNVLLTGTKLWAILPPGEASHALANDQGSALSWFLRNGQSLPPTTVTIIQRPGETVFVPNGWFHIVLNVEDTTALSSSLALRRDFKESYAICKEEDEEFAEKWLESVTGMDWSERFLPT